MMIPMIQGAIRRSRYLEDKENDYERHLGEGIAYAASVLPFVHACDPDDASTIHKNLLATNLDGVSFDDVRNAFARNLPCLQITCEEIGEVIELEFNGDTCSTIRSQVKTSSSASAGDIEEQSTSSTGKIILYTFLAITGAVICFLIVKLQKSKATKENEIVFSGNQADGDTIIKGEDYAPKYWSDCHAESQTTEESNVKTGEML